MKRLLVVMTVFLLIFAQVSFAQGPARKATFLVNAGFAVPSAPEVFADYWKTGINVGGGIGFLLERNLQFQGIVEYNNFAFDEDGFLNALGISGSGVAVDGASASIVTASANLRVLLSTGSASTAAYLIGGLSFFRLSTSDATVSYIGNSVTIPGDSETAAGVSFGGGISFEMNPRLDLFVEAKYGIGFTEGESTQYLPLKVGLEFK